MSKYFYKAEYRGVIYLRSSNGQYKAMFPKWVRKGITVTSSDAAWTFDEIKIQKAKGRRPVVMAQEISQSEFRALQQIGQKEAKVLLEAEREAFNKALAEALAELKTEKGA